MSTGLPRLASIPLTAFTALLLSACGAEVAATASTVGALQAAQLKQARDQQQQIEKNLGEALQAGQARASAADAQ